MNEWFPEPRERTAEMQGNKSMQSNTAFASIENTCFYRISFLVSALSQHRNSDTPARSFVQIVTVSVCQLTLAILKITWLVENMFQVFFWQMLKCRFRICEQTLVNCDILASHVLWPVPQGDLNSWLGNHGNNC